jgi:uncharacterized membrane protein YhaH (DUF805 family)
LIAFPLAQQDGAVKIRYALPARGFMPRGRRRARRPNRSGGAMVLPTIEPLIAGGVVVTTALTDAIYVQFTAAVAARRRVAAASWSSAWYLLAAFAVISYTSNWVYVLFAALGSWIGGFLSITALNRAAQSRPGEGRGSPHGGGPT